MLRRKFLKLTGLGTGALITIPTFGFATTSYEEAVTGILKKEIGYLDLDKKGIEKFIQDFSKDHDEKYRLKVRAMYLFGIKPDHSYTVNDIVRTYLLSTDFFLNQMNEHKTVHYIGLYNPYVRPCTQPFSNLYYPAVTS